MSVLLGIFERVAGGASDVSLLSLPRAVGGTAIPGRRPPRVAVPEHPVRRAALHGDLWLSSILLLLAVGGGFCLAGESG